MSYANPFGHNVNRGWISWTLLGSLFVNLPSMNKGPVQEKFHLYITRICENNDYFRDCKLYPINVKIVVQDGSP